MTDKVGTGAENTASTYSPAVLACAVAPRRIKAILIDWDAF